MSTSIEIDLQTPSSDDHTITIKTTYEYADTDLWIRSAALRDDWDYVCGLFEATPELKTKPVNERLETPLMIAVGTNSSHEFVKQLLNNVDHGNHCYDDEWCGMNIHGNNALHYAAKVGNIIDATLMIECLPRTMTWNKNIDGDTPLLLATKLGRKYMIDEVFSQYYMTFQLSGHIIVSAIQAGFLDLASDILEDTLPEELTAGVANGLEALATKREFFRSGNGLITL